MSEHKTKKVFISHSYQDDDVVRRLREELQLHGVDVWVDSREMRAGEILPTGIKQAIETSFAFIVLVSADSLQSDWVGPELKHALKIQKQRGKGKGGKDKFPVIPLLLGDTKLGAFKLLFEGDPLHIPVSSEPGGIDAKLDDILVALGTRLKAEVAADAGAKLQPAAEPLEELVLELSHLKLLDKDGIQRASGEAQLTYEPATEGQPSVKSQQNWRFTAPIGPIEAGELKWYLEQYAVWPSEYFRPRALKVEENLKAWGQLLYDAAMPTKHVSNVLAAWAKVEPGANRRFSVYIDADVVDGVPEDETLEARECATLLLGLPWELLHDGKVHLFQGAQPVRVRRRLPNKESFDVPVVKPPIRILLITARPEDESCGYIDHRASAEPLVSAMEALGGLVELDVLNPATLPALREALECQDYHVVHFDGHGVYNRNIGLGGLCFEHPEDSHKLTKRRPVIIDAQELGGLLNHYRIPLVFLEACQTAMSADASESVASELLQQGIASVVAMSHSVLVATARRFVKVFYRELAAGKRVGAAMLAGQRELKDQPSRGHIFGAGELKLADWFVPVLFQEKADPQLFANTAPPQAQDIAREAQQAQLKHLPKTPQTGFVGRSRELLALERLLQQQRYALVIGQGGEGKTALAAEFGRWMLRSRQLQRVVFVSVEISQHASAVLDALGQQLPNNYSVAQFNNLEEALQPIEQTLKEKRTLLVLDNMESILLPPYVQEATPEALKHENRAELEAILALCAQLNSMGDTRIIFTSRERLPAPFDGGKHIIGLDCLARTDAVKLVERSLNEQSASATSDADSTSRVTDASTRSQIEELVDAVNCHARTLTLLAPSLQSLGVAETTQKLVQLMAKMQGGREQSVFASVALSLERLSPENQDRLKVLGLFHGGVQLAVLKAMMGWQEEEASSLEQELVATGLATANRYGHLSLNAALCPFLYRQLQETGTDIEIKALKQRWISAMRAYAGFLQQQRSQDTQLAATLTLLELPNLFALLEQVAQAFEARAMDAEAIIDLCTDFHSLLKGLGKPRLLARIAALRDASENALGNSWKHARFEAQRIRIEQQLEQGQLQAAFDGAQQLLAKANAAGETAYADADYDLAMAHNLLGQVLHSGGAAEQALSLMHEAFNRFEAIAESQGSKSAAGMAAVCLTGKGDCLTDIGRLAEAANNYQECIQRAEQLGHQRQVAVAKGQLGYVRYMQKNYNEALEAYQQARTEFEQLGEPGSVAAVWHQTAMVYGRMRQAEAAESAYRKALAIHVQRDDLVEQAKTLGQLGNLYDDQLGRSEEAVAFFRQAADKFAEVGDIAGEGRQLGNLADCLCNLKRLEEARQAISRAIECDANFDHAAEPWKSWAIKCDIETDAGNAIAAAEARQKAFELFLAYRRDGGENHTGTGRLAYAIGQMLLAGEPSQVDTLLKEVEEQLNEAGFGLFHKALQEIIAGGRDRSLAEHPELYYRDAAEIVFLIETLAAAGK